MAWTDPRKQGAPKASELGAGAGYAGRSKQDCPYPEGSAQAREWLSWYDYGAGLKKNDEESARHG